MKLNNLQALRIPENYRQLTRYIFSALQLEELIDNLPSMILFDEFAVKACGFYCRHSCRRSRGFPSVILKEWSLCLTNASRKAVPYHENSTLFVMVLLMFIYSKSMSKLCFLSLVYVLTLKKYILMRNFGWNSVINLTSLYESNQNKSFCTKNSCAHPAGDLRVSFVKSSLNVPQAACSVIEECAIRIIKKGFTEFIDNKGMNKLLR